MKEDNGDHFYLYPSPSSDRCQALMTMDDDEFVQHCFRTNFSVLMNCIVLYCIYIFI